MTAHKVLVVDDSAMDRLLASRLLSKAGLDTLQANDGAQALDILTEHEPDVVVTDMQMPSMNGLELVEAVRARFSSLPVILMTAHGSEKVAAAALRSGAASYVSKRNLARDLASTVKDVLAIVLVGKRQEEIIANALEEVSLSYVIHNDLDVVPPLIRHIERYLRSFRLCDDAERLQVGVALREAITNAVYHGNLEVSSSLLMAGDGQGFYQLVKERQAKLPYSERVVQLSVKLSHDSATVVVRDQGPGFDPGAVPDPLDIEHLDKSHGRGLLLMRTFMDDVQHNATGNEVTMVKSRVGGGE